MIQSSHLSPRCWIAAVVCVGAFATGCGTATNKKNRDDAQVKIVGGKPVDPDVNDVRRLSTVALTTDAANQRRSTARHLLDLGRSFCTATIIGPRVLLTAAHCLQDFDPRTNQKSSAFIFPSTKDFIAFFGTRVSFAGEWVRASKVIPHEKWSPELTLQGNADAPPNDIGVMILENNIPESHMPVEIADETMSLKEGHPVTLVGFGVTRSRRNNNTGTLREVSLPLKSIEHKSNLLNVGSFMKGACAGDSGGPMYAQDDQGRWYVIGVTSAGIEILQNCIGVDNSYTDARKYKNWIRTTLAAEGVELK